MRLGGLVGVFFSNLPLLASLPRVCGGALGVAVVVPAEGDAERLVSVVVVVVYKEPKRSWPIFGVRMWLTRERGGSGLLPNP